MRSIILLVVLHAGLADAARHVPPGDAIAGIALELVVEAPPTTPSLVAHYRANPWVPYTPIELVRKDEEHWVAVIPGNNVVVPGLSYYIDAGDQPVFANAQWPHVMLVKPAPEDARRERDSRRSEANRYRMHAAGEWVDFGKRTVGDMTLKDDYYRFDADFAYRIWSYPLEELQFGYTYLIGDTLSEDKMTGTGAGFKVGGWFGLGLAAIEGVHFDIRVYALATENFQLGGRAEARLGILEGSHIALGSEYLADTGASGYFRLGWGTVPTLPMSATVEVTNMPSDKRDIGVRLYYDVARAINRNLKLGVRLGYAARDQLISGFTGGASATANF
jgi:hypothetical protein